MKLVLSPTYADLFDEQPPALETLIDKIPSKTVITVMSIINSQLYLKDDFETQIRILVLLMQRQPEALGARILRKVRSESKEKPAIQLFSVIYTMEFIHYELCHFRDIEFRDTSLEDELKILKAYFVIADRLNNQYSSTLARGEGVDEEYFRKNTWPAMIDQFDVTNNLIDPVKMMSRGIAFLNYLQYHSGYERFVRAFLDKRGKQTSWNYVLDLANLFQAHWAAGNDGKKRLKPFIIEETEGYELVLASFAVSVEQYRNEYGEAKMNYAGLKDKPLFLMEKGRYAVLNWNFLAAKIYDGLLFDFYQISGIAAEKKFKTFPDFKQFVGSEITEKFLFRRILRRCFNKKHVVLLLDEHGKEGVPDAYVRDGNSIFLFELKDAYFSSKSINSLSYQTIKESIDTKYNNDRKGVGQLVKHLKTLRDMGYEKESFETLGIKRRNLRIYPIIVFTDHNFSLPGINRYLDEEFRKKVTEQKLGEQFGRIEGLTFINLSFLLDHIHFLADPKFKLKDLMDFYHDKIASMQKRNRKQRSVQNLFAVNDPFESVVHSKFPRRSKINDDYVEVIVRELGLVENMPKDSGAEENLVDN